MGISKMEGDGHMQCKVCGSEHTRVIYNGEVRAGGVGVWTEKTPVYQCDDCNVIWHENLYDDIKRFYEGTEYREQVNGSSDADCFYALHDGESADKFRYTGTKIFRGKVVADVGCGAGAWLDFVKGTAKESIGIEPSQVFRALIQRKGITAFPYAEDAKAVYRGKVDVVTSFDVIEHVENPDAFLGDIYELLAPGGEAIVGTPTDTPVMRNLLGEIYEKMILFTAQHLWVFSPRNMEIMAERAGFSDIKFKCFQTYDLTNLLAWLQYKKPLSIGGNFGTPQKKVNYDFVTNTLNAVYKSELEKNFMGDYFVAYLKK